MTAKFNEPRLMGNCENCYYFSLLPEKYVHDGICHRYPDNLGKSRGDYCGEFAWRRDVETRGK